MPRVLPCLASLGISERHEAHSEDDARDKATDVRPKRNANELVEARHGRDDREEQLLAEPSAHSALVCV